MMKRLCQQWTIEKYAELRKTLIQADDRTTLNKLPRDASPVWVRNRYTLTGRPHGYLRKYDISRILLRELAYQGKIPGIRKFSRQFLERSLMMREKITLAYIETGDGNYATTKNRKVHPERMECMKYCPRLRKHAPYRKTK